jgi:hypothetical protein
MTVEPLLSQFPKPLTLYPSRSKYFILFVVSALGFYMSVVLAKQDSTATIWFCVVFCTVCAIVFATYLVPGSASLTLDADGFRVKQFYFVRKSRWQNVTSINVGDSPPSRIKFVRYNDTQWSGWRLARWETAALGYNAMLPDTYGMSADDLAALMTHWRDRVLALASTQ